jgi:voltage-gated potassium channel
MSTALELPSRRQSLTLVLRPLAIVSAVLVLYALTPVNAGPAAVAAGITALASLGFLLWVMVSQMRRIMRHPEPALAAIEALALLGTLFVLSFALTYVALSASDPASFSQPVDKIAGLYLSMTILSTVGFGDIVAVSDVARMTVVVQMTANLVLLAVVVRLITGVARRARAERPAHGSAVADTAD